MASMNRKLKIGLLLDSYQVPLWFAYMIEKIIEEGFAEISLIVLNQSEKKQKKIFFRVLFGLNTLIFRVFYSFENRMFKVKPNALKAVNIKEILPGVPTIQVTPLKTIYSDYFQNTDLDTLQSHNLDLFIRKGFRILRGKILTSCPLGIWSFHHGDTHAFRGGPPAFWEVMKNDPVTGCVLQILTEDLDNGIILSKGYASTDRMSVKKNRNNIYWKSAEMIPRKLKEIHRGSFYPDFNNVLSRDYLLYPLSINKVPGNSTMLTLLLGHAIRILRKKIRHQFFIDQWILMFDLRKNNTSYFRSLSRFKKIIPPSDRFWADPHLVHENGRYYVFFEELFYKNNKGHISYFEILENGNCTAPIKILEKEYHLAYPFVFKYQNIWYMIPDSLHNQTIECYKCDSFPEKWSFHTNLMENVPALDSTLHFKDDKWWLFTNIKANLGASTWDELHLFYSDSPFGKWNAHPKNPIVTDVRKARPAGKLMQVGNDLLRPSQDCSVKYGYGMTMHKIHVMNENEYIEEEIHKIHPTWDPAITAVHTQNTEGNLTVIDAQRRRFRWL